MVIAKEWQEGRMGFGILLGFLFCFVFLFSFLLFFFFCGTRA
jgi:hypothetical protein